ncbi:MAG TPA: hypothetical protein VGB88_08875 [Alphaproteobacteria bacterium]
MHGTVGLDRRGWARALAAAVVAALALAACSESDEDKATAAYERGDFQAAGALAGALAAAGNPRGLELLALMAAQGLGRAIDYGEAFALIDRAIALNPSYADTRAAIEARRTAATAASAKAFDTGDYERAYDIARPLAAFGDDDSARLVDALVTGHYIRLPGSDMSWRRFWEQCSGNTRFETEAEAEAGFDSGCAGLHAVWDGLVVRALPGELHVKMTPGRPAAHHDITLMLDPPPDPELASPGRKVRFAGVVAARGTPSRPDVLAQGAIIGPAPLTAEEASHEQTVVLQAVMNACQTLVEERFRAELMPQWAIEVEAQVRAGGSPRSRAFSLFVGITSGPDAFARQADGTWHGRFDGTVTIQSVVARTAQVTEYTADCTIDGAYRRGDRPGEHGVLSFVRVAEPLVESAPARLR